MHTAGPALCELRAGESRRRVFRALVALNQGMLTLSGLVFCIVLVVNHWFVDWWVTRRQYGGVLLTVLILVSMVIRHWTTTTGYAVFCFGYQRRSSLTSLADGLVTAGACLACTSLWGVAGAPAGSIIGACLISLPLNLYRIANDTDSSALALTRSMLGGWFWRFTLLAGGAAWAASRWSPRSLAEACAAVAGIGAIYSLVMLPNLMHGPLADYIKPLLSAYREKFAAWQVPFSPEPRPGVEHAEQEYAIQPHAHSDR
jgi:hypothetical protein